jgi:FkbM family methyltransferase
LPADPDVRAAATRWVEARDAFYHTAGPIPVSRADREILADLKDRYRGERIFVLGNGPSLNDTPLHLLGDEFTFGVNRVYLLFDRIRWRPTFYTTVDWRVTADCAPEINLLTGMQIFFPERFRGILRDGDDVTWYWNGPSLDPAQRSFATDASLGIRGAGSVTGAAIQLAFHMGFDPIYLLGCDVSYSIPETVIQEGPDQFGNGVGLFLTSTQDDDANHFDPRYFGAGRKWHDPNVKRMIEGFQQCRDGADRVGRRILNATVGGQLEVFERVPVRSLFSRKGPARRVNPDPAPVAAQGLPVAEREHVAAPLLVQALLDRDQPGLVLDIGAGTGKSLGAFAAAGWEVRAFEPDPMTHDELVDVLPPGWPVFVDPRALGCVEHAAPIFRSPFGGGSLVPRTARVEPSATVTVTTPDVALTTLRGRKPDVVLISASGWELEILRAYPFDLARPDAVVVDVDDLFTPRLGYRGRDLAKELESHDYEVFALEHRRTGPNEATQAVCGVLESEAGLTHLIALPPGLASLEAIERCRRAVLMARLEMSSTAALRSGGKAHMSLPADVHVLRRELEAVHASASWRLGHGIVLTAKRTVRPLRRLAAAARRHVRHSLTRDGAAS